MSMSKRAYRLDSKLLTTTADMTLWKNTRGNVEITRGTLAVEVLLDDQPCGYVFQGSGSLLLDAIVETESGAVGNSVERALTEPFLMLGRLEDEQQQFQESGTEDFTKWGFENQDEFVGKAEGLLDKFFERSTCRNRHADGPWGTEARVFAFPNSQGRLDLLLTKGSRLVYTSPDRVFVMKGDKMVLTSRGSVAVSRPGKSVLVEGNCCSHVYEHWHDCC
jgi:hypothetical protein